jgi:ADP-ribose pyrophosphatase
MKFETLQSTPIFQGRVFSVRQDQVRLPDGRTTSLDIIDHRGSVTLLPVDAQGEVWFVRQYRHAAGDDLLELPAGVLEPGEDAADCALRELREETGMAAKNLQKIGQFYLAAGYSTELMHVYLATELYPAPLAGDADEFLAVERIPLAEISARIQAGEVIDAKTLAAFQLAAPHLRKTTPHSPF